METRFTVGCTCHIQLVIAITLWIVFHVHVNKSMPTFSPPACTSATNAIILELDKYDLSVTSAAFTARGVRFFTCDPSHTLVTMT